MVKSKKIIQTLLIISLTAITFSSAKAMNKKEIFRPNEHMFSSSPLEKNELESFSISLGKKLDFKANGPAAQIFIKAFCNQIFKEFYRDNEYSIRKYFDDNKIFPIKKAILENNFKIDVDLMKNARNHDELKNDFKTLIGKITAKDKSKLKKIINATKKDLKQNFEKYRKEIRKDLEKIKPYFSERAKIFNKSVLEQKNDFVKDFNNFAEIYAKSHEMLNTNKNKNLRELHKEAEQIRKDAKNLNINSKVFKKYKEKMMGPKISEIKNFVDKYKVSLSKVSKKQTLECVENLLKSGIKLSKY